MFQNQISEGAYHTQRLRQKGSIVFIVQRQILSEKNADNCNTIIMSRKMERESPQGD